MTAKLFRLLKRTLLLLVVVAATFLLCARTIPSAGRRCSSGTPTCRTRCGRRRSTRPTGPDYLKAEEAVFRERPRRGDRQARGRGPQRRQSLLRRQPDLSRAISRRTGTAPTSWSPTGRRSARSVLLHGLTDSPYSLRHIARRYRDRGFVAVAIRLPGHGTVPAAPDRGRVGGLGRRHAACGARGAAARRAVDAACTSSASPTAARWR